MHAHLAFLTVLLYIPFVILGWLVGRGSPQIELQAVLWGPLLPLVHSLRFAFSPARDEDVWLGLLTVIPIITWVIAAKWAQHVWLERVAVAAIIGVYLVLLVAIGVGA